MISFPPLFSTCFAREKATEGSYIRKERNSYAKTIVLSGLHLSQCLHDRIVDFIEYATFLVFANICYFVTKSSTIDPFFAFTRAQTLLKRVVRSIKVSADFKVIVSPLEKKARHHRCAQRYIKFRWRSARPAANYPRLVFSQPDFPFFFFSKKSDHPENSMTFSSFHVKAIDLFSFRSNRRTVSNLIIINEKLCVHTHVRLHERWFPGGRLSSD